MHTTGGPTDPETVRLRRIGSVGPVPHPRAADRAEAVAEPETEPAAPGPATAAPAAPAASAAGRNGLIMAVGSLASRGLGFVRSSVIAAALGATATAGAFNVANSLPNVVYYMLLGGVLNSVFVPELVHAAQTHKDGGVAYTDRLLTICGTGLAILTAGAWLFAPQVVDLFSTYSGAQRELTIAFARTCLPQILFYGVFTLLGQVLNARDRYGAMAWTPVLNNVVAIAVFGGYIVIAGQVHGSAHLSHGDVLLLGWGSTLGIVVQTLAVLPALRSAGFRWRPRFDWRGAGLAKPLRSASWALGLVVLSQTSVALITRLTTGADDRALHAGLHLGLGNAAFNNAYQLFIVPQSVITMSLVTAVVPKMARAAAAGRLTEIGSEIGRALSASGAMIVPVTAVFIALAPQLTAIAYGHGATTPADTWVMAEVLIAFSLGLVPFCAEYALARGFYAMSDARTPFWLRVVTSVINVALCYAAYDALGPRWVIIGMAAAQSVAAWVSIFTTGTVLSRRLGTGGGANRRGRQRSGLGGGRVWAVHLALALACLPGALAAHWLADHAATALGGGLPANLAGLALGSVAILLSLLVLSRPLGAGAVVAPLAARLRIPYPAPTPSGASGGRHRR